MFKYQIDGSVLEGTHQEIREYEAYEVKKHPLAMAPKELKKPKFLIGSRGGVIVNVDDTPYYRNEDNGQLAPVEAINTSAYGKKMKNAVRDLQILTVGEAHALSV